MITGIYSIVLPHPVAGFLLLSVLRDQVVWPISYRKSCTLRVMQTYPGETFFGRNITLRDCTSLRGMFVPNAGRGAVRIATKRMMLDKLTPWEAETSKIRTRNKRACGGPYSAA